MPNFSNDSTIECSASNRREAKDNLILATKIWDRRDRVLNNAHFPVPHSHISSPARLDARRAQLLESISPRLGWKLKASHLLIIRLFSPLLLHYVDMDLVQRSHGKGNATIGSLLTAAVKDTARLGVETRGA